MNSLARASLSAHMVSSSPSPGIRLLHLLPVAAVQECKFFSTRTIRSSQKVQQLTKPKTQKSSQSSSSGFSRGIKKKTEGLATVWPRPTEIQYEAKAANFVHLIGYVEIPVKFEVDSDGKHFASTVVSLGNAGVRNSLSIPVMFEEDLAHIVSCHVKENDCVFISGKLSVDPMRLGLSEKLGKFHIVVENLNFVQGFEKDVVDKRMRASISGVEIDKAEDHGLNNTEEVVERVVQKNLVDKGTMVSFSGNKSDKAGKVVERVYDDVDSNQQWTRVILYNEQTTDRGSEKNGESASKKTNGDEILDLWRDLVRSPLQWWDYRGHKANGLVKEKFPDFKQKVTGKPLWINTAPKWIFPGLGSLEFDVKDFNPKQGDEGQSERRRSSKTDDSWKSLVENPEKWWDNRMKKKNPKAPDFRHKDTGEVLWLNSSPPWALSRIPQA